MPDWDEDSPQLRENLTKVLEEASRGSRQTPTLEWARRWHALIMQGLDVPNAHFVGSFRGESGLENVQVKVGPNRATSSTKVAGELKRFEATLRTLVAQLDAILPLGHEPNADQLAAVIDLCAWAHAEWVRIHPFANGNGRAARIWANCLAMRYGVPPFIGLRPRPNTGYAEAGAKAMQGDWKPTVVVFVRLFNDFLEIGTVSLEILPGVP